MKIRIKGNSIRYRLSQSEVKRFSETGHIMESTVFGDVPEKCFNYALRSKAGIAGMEAAFEGTTICLFVPEEAVQHWYHSEQIGFENNYDVAAGTSLHLLLEKDFVCLDKTDEDQSDNYPNPNKAC